MVEPGQEASRARSEPLVRIGGICGETTQAVHEAQLLVDLRFSAGLLSLAALKAADDAALLSHCRIVADVLPLVGFYLATLGGRAHTLISLLAGVR
jgi:hypothetical protein